jgi:hypothetical protein
MICGHCGAELVEGFRFCDKCGKPTIEQGTEAGSPPEARSEARPEADFSAAPAAPIAKESEPQIDSAEPPRREKRSEWGYLLAIGLLLAVVCIVCAGSVTGAYFLLGLNEGDEATRIVVADTREPDEDSAEVAEEGEAPAAPEERPEPAEPTATPTTGIITGMVRHDSGLPIKNTKENETMVVALLCASDDSDIECFTQEDLQGVEEVDGKIESICEADDTAENCLVHLGQGATSVEADGSYTLADIPPGQYGLGFFIIVPGNLYFWGKYDVESVQAGKITKYDIATEPIGS